MISSLGSLNAYSYQTNLSSNGAKLYVPVSKSALLYSHFDHISGIAAGSGQYGVSISKIQILNSLLDHLSSIRNEVKTPSKQLSNTQTDELIKNFQKQLQQVANQTPFLLSGAKPITGSLFSIDI